MEGTTKRRGCARRHGVISAMALATAGLFSWHLPAAAQSDGQRLVSVSVTPLTEPIKVADNVATYQFSYNTTTPLTDFRIGYRVRIANNGTSTINNFVFVGTADATQSSDPTFASIEGFGPTLTCSGTGSTVTCAVGTLNAMSSTEFNVYFRSPLQASGVTPGVYGSCSTTDCALFKGELRYAEGSPTPPNSAQLWEAPESLLGTSNPATVKSAVSQDGGEFFTGSGVATSGDRAATRLKVPAATNAVATALAIEETVAQDPNCNSFKTCYDTKLSVKDADGNLRIYDAADPLSIVLRQDSQNLKGTKLGAVLLDYVSDDGISYPLDPTTRSCDLDSSGKPVANSETSGKYGIPCVVECKIFSRTRDRLDPEWTSELAGDLQCKLLNTKNGRLVLR